MHDSHLSYKYQSKIFKTHNTQQGGKTDATLDTRRKMNQQISSIVLDKN